MSKLRIGYVPSPPAVIGSPGWMTAWSTLEGNLKREVKQGTAIGKCCLFSSAKSDYHSANCIVERVLMLSLQEVWQLMSTYGKNRPESLVPSLSLGLSLFREIQSRTGIPFGRWLSLEKSLKSPRKSLLDTTMPSQRSKRIICKPLVKKDSVGFFMEGQEQANQDVPGKKQG